MYKGILLLLLSSLNFALSTVFVKLVTSNSNINSLQLAFVRFFFGFLFTCIYIVYKKKSIIPNNIKYIFLRSIFNTIAVIFFFAGIQHSTVTKVNLLNMTYPAFVFILAPFINKEKIAFTYIFYLALTCVGIYFVIIPESQALTLTSINKGDTFGLVSGIVAGFAISSLRQARKFDASHVILFYLMATGTIITFILSFSTLTLPQGIIMLFTIACAITAIAGQILITIGYKYINAAAGSIVSSTRIIFAAILGILIFSDELTQRVSGGSTLILISLIGVSGIFKYIFTKKIRDKLTRIL